MTQGAAKLCLLPLQVITYTHSEPDAGTSAAVFIDIHGNKGNSGRQPLHNDDYSCFSPSQADMFKLQLPKLGELTSIVIGMHGQNYTAYTANVQACLEAQVATITIITSRVSCTSGWDIQSCSSTLPGVRTLLLLQGFGALMHARTRE